MDTVQGGPLAAVLHDLQRIFAARLESLVAYGRGEPASSLALVASLTADDLAACAARARAWHKAGAATPLLLTRAEFARSLDAFPIEYGEIMDSCRPVFGESPFAGLAIDAADLRRACEVQVKSHLLHLRENYVECGARPAEVSALVADSAPAFAALLRRLARLDGLGALDAAALGGFAARRAGLDARVVGDVLSLADGGGEADAARFFPAYLRAVEQLAQFIDRWHEE